MRHSLLPIISLILTSVVSLNIAQGQSTDISTDDDPVGILLSRELSFGMRLNSNGWGIFSNYSRFRNIRKSRLYHFEFLELKHPKELKRSNDFAPGGQSPKPFVFGKQNSFFALHAGIGEKIFLGERAERAGVEVNLIYAVGPSLGLLKPYYLEINTRRVDSTSIVVSTKYDPNDPSSDFLNFQSIFGSSGFRKGLNEIRFVPGLHGKLGFSFDWANYSDFIKALDVGLSADVFLKRIPVMVSQSNRYYMIYLYVGIQFGRKW